MKYPESDARSAGISGFTLIELSVVLIIIGLIVGGILTGQTLTEAAQVRNQIKQLGDLETQINTFKVKYNCLPGDCANITTFLATPDAKGYAIVNGDGDGLIRSTQGAGAPFPTGDCGSGQVTGTELPQLFLQLNDALVGSYTTDGNAAAAGIGWGLLSAINNGTGLLVSCDTDIVNNAFYTPLDMTLNTGNVMMIGVSPDVTNFAATRMLFMNGEEQWGNTAFNYRPIGIPVNYVQSMDQKIDDGMPLTGRFGLISGPPSGCLTGTNVYPTGNACNVTAGKSLN